LETHEQWLSKAAHITNTCNFTLPITEAEDRIQMERLELIVGSKIKFTKYSFDNLVYLSSCCRLYSSPIPSW